MREFNRKRLKHGIPPWVKDGELYFITINTQPRGRNALAKDDIARELKRAFQSYTDLNKWWPRLVVLMPDHLHALLSLNTREHSIAQIISPWKAYLAKTVQLKWQEGFFEHRVRSQSSLEEKADYLRQNPVRAGLIQKPADWPYIWESSDFDG